MVDRYEWFGSLMQSNLDLLLADLVNVSWASFSVQTFQSREPKPLHPKPRIPFLGFGRKPGPTRFIGDARTVVFRPT